ncbi:hypothetical protein [Streptomyces hokutonensis]|uniref:hypothetical protein n=1 Tax=Streptomyces hokutonensis TaxID=1306990 RepID=UPI00036EDF86|nr:hypothetical protein [Streptomyces hokutonensis]
MLNNFMAQAWTEYVAGVLVLATGAATGALARAWRRRRRLRLDQETAAGNSE